MIETTLSVLEYLQAAVLLTAFPLSMIAAYGFYGTPWGRVLSPIPVMEVTFAIGIGIGIMEFGGDWLYVQVVAYGIGVGAVCVTAFRIARLATGGARA